VQFPENAKFPGFPQIVFLTINLKSQRSIPWNRKQIFEYELPYKIYNLRTITVVAKAFEISLAKTAIRGFFN